MSQVLCRWTAHPARRRPRDVALVVAVVSTTSGVVLMTFNSALLAALAALILAVAIAPFLLPTRYTLTDEGISAERAFGRRTRRYQDLRRVSVGPGAALVSPFARPNWLDRQRGILVLFDGADRQKVVSILRDKVKP